SKPAKWPAGPSLNEMRLSMSSMPIFLYSRGRRLGKGLQDYIVVKRSALQELCSSVLEQLSGTPGLDGVENGR
ncbi:MAG TPA: hypothetical protein VNY04_02260, partial [Chthoniobacterales bacterium]|nr:hypothetical protein [Chthoniobacterales bacterium]